MPISMEHEAPVERVPPALKIEVTKESMHGRCHLYSQENGYASCMQDWRGLGAMDVYYLSGLLTSCTPLFSTSSNFHRGGW